MRKVLITGTAGFIGFHLARMLLDEGFRVQGYDGMSEYYDVRLKQRRHQILLQNPGLARPRRCWRTARRWTGWRMRFSPR